MSVIGAAGPHTGEEGEVPCGTASNPLDDEGPAPLARFRASDLRFCWSG